MKPTVETAYQRPQVMLKGIKTCLGSDTEPMLNLQVESTCQPPSYDGGSSITFGNQTISAENQVR